MHIFDLLTQNNPSLSLAKTLLTSTMAAKTLTPKSDTGKNPLAFMIFPDENDQGGDFLSEPQSLKEKVSNWVNQVLILFSLSGKLLAFLGSYPTASHILGKLRTSFQVTQLQCLQRSKNALSIFLLWPNLRVLFDLRL